MELRHYQRAAVDSVRAEWADGRRKTLVVCPTGTGKTVIFAALIQEVVAAGQQVLVLAHREELIQQAADKIEKTTRIPTAIEKGNFSAVGSFFPVTIASVQTLQREKRLHRYDPDYFDVVIIDEAHHSLSSGYRKIIDYFNANYLGVTATPDRGDKKSLGQVFDSIAYEYSLTTAINEKYLVPIVAKQIPLEINLAGVKQSAGDFSASESGHAIEPYLDAIALEIKKHCENRKTVVFLPLIDTSKKMKLALNRVGMMAAEVNGNSKDREQIIADFEQGKYNVLCNAMLLTEGWDCPAVDCVVVLRPTRVRSLFAQMVGRGTRLFPGKKDLLVLDFLWQIGRIDLCRPTSLFADNEEKAKKMQEKLTEAGAEEVDLMELEKEAERDIITERENAMREALEVNRGRRGKTVNVMELEFALGESLLSNYEPAFLWEMAPPTTKQLDALKSMGIDTDGIETKGQASVLLDRLYKRMEAGLCTPKQIKILERYNIANARMMSKNEATKIISIIDNHGWRQTAALYQDLAKWTVSA